MNSFFRHSVLLFLLLNFSISPSIGGEGSSLKEYKALLSKAEDNGNDGKAAYYCYEIAKIYLDQNKTDLAEDYLSDCISYGKDADDSMLVYLAYQLEGTLYFQKTDYRKALRNYQRALKYAEELGKTEFITDGLLNEANSYAILGRHNRAVGSLENALSIAIREDDITLQEECYQRLAAYYKVLEENVKAKEYQTLYDKLIESQKNKAQTKQQLTELEQEVQKTQKEKQSARWRLNSKNKKLLETEDSLLSVKYSLEETTQSLRLAEEISSIQLLQIDLLNKDKKLAEMRIKEQNAQLRYEAYIRNSIIFGTFLSLAFGLVTFRNYRRKLEANKEIERQNKNIQRSINYATRIQEAMLHKSEEQKEVLPESFVLFKPRDSVSGDFYWISEIKSWYDPDVVIAAVDCTGHGIPGAFMSMIGMNALSSIIGQGIAESDQILHSLDTEIRAALQQETTGNKDGMDVALCIYRREKDLIEFSGAKNPLIYIQNNELHQIKGDVHPIGGNKPKKEFSYKKHVVTIDTPTTIYLFSDGFQDQFGGPENTKYMSKRFKNLLLEIHQHPMEKQKEILDQTITDWIGEGKQTDDILVMGIRLDENFED